MIDNMEIKCSVGALMYSPALNQKTAEDILQGKFGDKYSLALCLEDTVSPDMVGCAERQVGETFRHLWEGLSEFDGYLPKIFVRVREPQQMERIFCRINPYRDLLTGFIFPKYTVGNADAYNQELRKINEKAGKPYYMMPILESRDIVDLRGRADILGRIKDKIDEMSDVVLNVRVGGNDFSNEFAVRRHCDETIYDILPIAQLLGDILNVFSREYIVSGPVWEYFGGEDGDWERGLRREARLDKLNGFVGKTVIHPKQIPVINEVLRVSRKDYEDAKTILNWDSHGLQVGKSFGGERMNEVRTHYNWARKVMVLAQNYGIE